MLYCVFYIPNVFFLAFKQFDGTKPIQLLKTYAKNVYKCIGFLYENYQQQLYTVVYNLPTIHSIQRYNGFCELIMYSNR